jgi:hypothetical protein
MNDAELLTKFNLPCMDCKEDKPLVIIRHRARLCLDCYKKKLEHSKTIRQLNNICVGILNE